MWFPTMWHYDMNRLRGACVASFEHRNFKCCSVSSLTAINIIFKGLARALISLRVCVGWSEPLLVAHTTLLEISCPGSNVKVYIVGGA